MIADDPAPLGAHRESQTLTVARNVSTRYAAIGLEAVLGVVVLPFNVAHLGQSAYGLWMLTASVTAYFSVLDLGYSGALVKFVAQYRARRDVAALNEIVSTLFFVFALFAAAIYLLAVVVAVFLGSFFQLTPEQVHVGRTVLLIISLNAAGAALFSVFGGVINGFQRYDLNNVVGSVSAIVTYAVNIAVLLLGFGLIELVIATTAVRVLTYWVYRANAYQVFPGLRIRWSLFRMARLREVTGFSIYMALIDWANKLNFSVDAIVIGAFINTAAVAVWTVAQRVAEFTQRLTNQLNDVLFPTVVDNDSAARADRLRAIFVQGTRLSLATVVPLCTALFLMAGPLIQTWMGPDFSGAIIVLQLLSVVVVVRVGAATATTVLKGAGRHRLVAFANTGAAVCNVLLSIATVRHFGLTGVAMGTLVPVCLISAFVLFPAGCERVGLPIAAAFGEAVWPAVWPAAIMVAAILATRHLVADSLVFIGVQMAVATSVYAAVFLFFGISTGERRVYFLKAGELVTRWRPQAVSEGA